MGLPAYLGVIVRAGLKEDGAERVGEVKLRPAIVDGCCPVPGNATGRLAPLDRLIPGDAPPFCPTPVVVGCAFAAYVEVLNTVLPPGDAATLLVLAKGMAGLRLERFPVAVLVPARFSATCGLTVAAPETDRLEGEAASPLIEFPPNPAIE